MKTLSRAGRLGRKFKKVQTVMIILIPAYFIARTVIGLIFNIQIMKGTQPHYENETKQYDVIDIVNDYKLNFCRGNILKYIIRAGKKKDEIGDLVKAQDYLKRELERLREKPLEF